MVDWSGIIMSIPRGGRPIAECGWPKSWVLFVAQPVMTQERLEDCGRSSIRFFGLSADPCQLSVLEVEFLIPVAEMISLDDEEDDGSDTGRFSCRGGRCTEIGQAKRGNILLERYMMATLAEVSRVPKGSKDCDPI